MNINNESENIFKRKIEISEINSFINHILKTWINKLDVKNIDELYQNELINIKNIETIDINTHEINCFKKSVLKVISELTTFTCSNIITNISRYIKRPYSNDIINTISIIHEFFEKLEKEYLLDSNNNISLILLLIFISRFLNTHLDKVITNIRNNLKWYYGDYNTIIDNILNDENFESIYWMNNNMNWESYNDESTIVIILEEDKLYNHLIRCFLDLLVAVHVYKKDINFIIVNQSNAPEFMNNYNLINLENIKYFDL